MERDNNTEHKDIWPGRPTSGILWQIAPSVLLWGCYHCGASETIPSKQNALPEAQEESVTAIQEKEAQILLDQGELNMTEQADKTVIRNADGERIVAIMDIADNMLNGTCVWYNGNGDPIAYGLFRQGVPWAGTFINWSTAFGEINKEDPYAVEAYCKDWVSIYEAGFDSISPTYRNLIEAYENGRRISTQ